MVIAKWREGYEGLFHGADAQKVAEEIAQIGKEVTTDEIVDAARDERSELHKCFEWDDAKAAELYRKRQAGYIIHHLVYKEDTVPQDRPEIKILHRPQGSHTYSEAKLIVQDDDKYDRLLKQAYAELRAFKVKYSCLEELKDILDLID